MEANVCDINRLEGDVLLPPRKRLLAGLKKQNPNGKSHILSVFPTASSEFNTRLNNLLSSHLNDPNLSTEDIAEASKSAAVAAVKVAEAARAAAEEKAAVAAKAVAAAKSALELVASFSEEAASKERHLKRNKLKKQVPVQLLYRKHEQVEGRSTDEELARKLHRDMNSSPRISKNCSSSDWKNNKHKKPKTINMVEKTRVPNGSIVLERSSSSTCNGHAVEGMADSEGSIREVYTVKTNQKGLKSKKANKLEINIREVEAGHSKEKISEILDDACTVGKKRGRIKLKKLPLSICTFRDQANPKEEMKARHSPLTEENRGKSAGGNESLLSVESSASGVMPIEAASVWKCQEFKAPECVKQNKIKS
ncbi:uncharacterized protein LOC131151525 [Malania oleifera]|uniref:uncharacterized protein LOC131151525 n=1 Tax=Malania oleifera TaxID=397392 RepID=UPI0025AE5093|nr:uncharacterized protein LOC131151525 [Malania oleifera]XP_057958756.1 uncharacterized protein LOC131151525 [Malania oleifera]XP_057958761.1 uncharacterized protein LOC131151525 [Malania oleifera]XP_057958768.1 uncharacterized protein LOC131151525 [Malania oleifera]XP_057958774.1 uncharacterized protein LOC131151525 [Malania oleifera]XP_057958779.1 uncharacterized protein LOC131151525 [Malania oleifera]